MSQTSTFRKPEWINNMNKLRIHETREILIKPFCVWFYITQQAVKLTQHRLNGACGELWWSYQTDILLKVHVQGFFNILVHIIGDLIHYW